MDTEALELLDKFASEQNLNQNEDGVELEKTDEFYKMVAEKAEEFGKENKESKIKEEYAVNMQKRAMKALKGTKYSIADEVIEKKKIIKEIPKESSFKTLSRDDWASLKDAGIKEDSDKANYLLKMLDGGLITDIASGLEDAGVEATLKNFQDKADLASIIGQDKEEFVLKTREENYNDFLNKNTIPENEADADILADRVLDGIV